MVKKTVLITGGTDGLGKRLVEVFLKNGWNVATFGRRIELIREIEHENLGKSLLVKQCDITLSNQVDIFLNAVWDNFDGVDLVILNASALGPTPLVPFRDLKLDAFREVYETNIFGNVSLIMKLIKRSGNRHIAIAHVTSDAGATPYENWSPYGSSKAAMDFIIKILNAEGERVGLKAFNFDPGDMNTEMHRRALPDDKPEKLKDPLLSAEEMFSNIIKGGYL